MTHEELILKAREAKSVEELMTLAKENDIDLTEESAKAYYEKLQKTGEVSDDELDNVSGGGCGVYTPDDNLLVGIYNQCDLFECFYCGRPYDGDHKHRCHDEKTGELVFRENECHNCKHSNGKVHGPKSFFFEACTRRKK